MNILKRYGVLISLLLTGCATYHVTTPEGWTADVRTTRKLESAKIYVSPDGSMEVELGGVDYPDYSRYLPYPVPVYPPMNYNPEYKRL